MIVENVLPQGGMIWNINLLHVVMQTIGAMCIFVKFFVCGISFLYCFIQSGSGSSCIVIKSGRRDNASATTLVLPGLYKILKWYAWRSSTHRACRRFSLSWVWR